MRNRHPVLFALQSFFSSSEEIPPVPPDWMKHEVVLKKMKKNGDRVANALRKLVEDGRLEMQLFPVKRKKGIRKVKHYRVVTSI